MFFHLNSIIFFHKGLALLVAMMIVVYRYYVYRRKGAEWEELDRLEEKRNARKIQLQVSVFYVFILASVVGF